MLEVLVAVSLLVVGMLGFSHAIVATARSNSVAREEALATEAARQMAHTLMGATFGQAFALFNEPDGDDPGGFNTAPGKDFVVAGLTPRENDPDGRVGEILFPTMGAGTATQLREDVVDARFGTPRDLDGDAVIDALDHSADYLLLPVVIRLQWRGSAGGSTFEFRTLLVGYS